MKIIETDKITPGSLNSLDEYHTYCGLDSCLTHEILGKTKPQLDETTTRVYNFSRALQAPILEIMLRGIETDRYQVGRLIGIFTKRKEVLFTIAQEYSWAMWDRGINPNSHQQVKELFYEYMGLPKIYKFEKGVKKLTVNRDALEKLQMYRYARPMAMVILAYKDLAKKIGVLRSGIDEDGRMRFSYNIGGTNTGRLSSNKNVFGGGTNGQNITDELRRIFIAEEGRKFAYLDLEQAESRKVAYLSGDQNYIDACESSDLHVAVAKLIWPELDWSPNGEPTHDREVAEKKFWRHWSYRDLSKRGGHLTNYMGQAPANARNLHISVDLMKKFQSTYFKAFPGIKRWHTDVARVLQTKSQITTAMGRKRLFFGRGWEDDILRKAVAYDPQSSVGDILNLGMYRVWKSVKEARLLAQLHDAILISYKDDPVIEERVLKQAKECLIIPLNITETRLRNPVTRLMHIPVDIVVGWNWSKASNDNPDGLVKYRGPEQRVRQVSPSTDLLKLIM